MSYPTLHVLQRRGRDPLGRLAVLRGLLLRQPALGAREPHAHHLRHHRPEPAAARRRRGEGEAGASPLDAAPRAAPRLVPCPSSTRTSSTSPARSSSRWPRCSCSPPSARSSTRSRGAWAAPSTGAASSRNCSPLSRARRAGRWSASSARSPCASSSCCCAIVVGRALGASGVPAHRHGLPGRVRVPRPLAKTVVGPVRARHRGAHGLPVHFLREVYLASEADGRGSSRASAVAGCRVARRYSHRRGEERRRDRHFEEREPRRGARVGEGAQPPLPTA